jgi:hypothetical protein
METKPIKTLKLKEKIYLADIKHKKFEYLKAIFFLPAQLVKDKYFLNEESKINLKEMLLMRLRKAMVKQLKIKA